MEEKQVEILRRKFLVGFPTFAVSGYLGMRYLTSRVGGWKGRLARFGGAVVTPVIGSMLIVHFNRAEIFRIGSSMLRQMDELRRLEEGIFKDPAICEKLDEQMRHGKFQKMFHCNNKISDNDYSGIDYAKIVNDSVEEIY